MALEKPGWAVRLSQERHARGWTQQRTLDELRRAAEPEQLVNDDHLMRDWHNWEGGHRRPQRRNREFIARAFGIDVDDLFSGRTITGLYTSVDPSAVELMERMRRSDLGQSELDAIAITIDQLATGYSSESPADLLDESNRWLARLDVMLNSRLTTRQHGALMVAAGWLGLLIGSLSYDMNDTRATEAVRRFVAEISGETNHGEMSAWVQELKAWTALNEGDYLRTVDEARSGQAMAPHSPVAVQLAGHEAEALARIGDIPAARKALDVMRDGRTQLPQPDTPRHHFQLEPRKFDKFDMRLLTLFGNHDEAAELAQQILNANRRPDGTWRQPMLATKALATLSIHAAHHCDIDVAVDRAHQALDIPRQSIPSVQSSMADVLAALRPAQIDSEVEALKVRIRDL